MDLAAAILGCLALLCHARRVVNEHRGHVAALDAEIATLRAGIYRRDYLDRGRLPLPIKENA